MSEAKSKPQPLPTKDQTLEEFEAEELSKKLEDGSPMYPDVTIETLLKDADYKATREHPNFRAMLERSNRDDLLKMLDEQVDTPKDQTPTPEKPAAQEAKVEAVPQVPAAAVIDVPEEPAMEAMPLEAVSESTSDEPPSSSTFKPAYKVDSHSLLNKMPITESNGFMHISDGGMSDLLDNPGYDINKKSGSAFYLHYHKYVGCGTVQPLPSPTEEGYVTQSSHNYSTGVGSQMGPLLRREISSDQPNRNTVRELLLRGEALSEQIGTDSNNDERDKEVVFVSLRNETLNPVITQVINVTPYRIPIILNKIKALKYLHVSQAAFEARAAFPFMSERIIGMLRRQNATEEDIVNDRQLKVTMTPRIVIPADENRYYYQAARSATPRIYSELLERSLGIAGSYFNKIVQSARMLDFNVGRTSSTTIAELNRILPSEAAIFARTLGGALTGGIRHEIAINVSEPTADSINVLRPLACMANLLMLDKNVIASDSIVACIIGVLTPFMHDQNGTQVRVRAAEPRPGEPDGPNEIGPRRGAIALGNQIYQRAMNGDLNPANAREIRDSFSTILGGLKPDRRRETKNEVSRILAAIINEALSVEFNRMILREKVFDFDPNNDRAPFSPFFKDEGVEEAILFGTGVHYTDDYIPQCQPLQNNLLQYAELLSKLEEVGRVLPILRTALRETRHMALSNAIFVDAQVKCMYNEHEVIPWMNNNEIPMDRIELPFAGALSYMLYGVNTSEATNDASPYMKYIPQTEYELPSLYGLYIYLEKAIAVEVFEHFSAAEFKYHILKQAELVTHTMNILKKYFVTLDPLTEGRLKEMFLNYDRHLLNQNDVPRVPPELKMLLDDYTVQTRGSDANNDKYSRDQYGSMLEADANELADAQDVALLPRTLQFMQKPLRTVIISDRKVPPITMINAKQQKVSFYALPSIPEDSITLTELLRTTRLVHSANLDVTTIRQLARERGIGNVIVDDVYASYKLVEQSGLTDTIAQEGKVTVKRKDEQDAIKFEVSDLTVYFRHHTDEYAVDARGNDGPGMLNPTFATHVGILWDDISRDLVNMDGRDIYDPKLLELESNLRIKDGSGYVFSVPMKLATRESEEIVIKQKLDVRNPF